MADHDGRVSRRYRELPETDGRDVELERERYPGYTIPDALWSRVRPR